MLHIKSGRKTVENLFFHYVLHREILKKCFAILVVTPMLWYNPVWAFGPGGRLSKGFFSYRGQTGISMYIHSFTSISWYMQILLESPPPELKLNTEVYHSIGSQKSYKCQSNRIARSLRRRSGLVPSQYSDILLRTRYIQV